MTHLPIRRGAILIAAAFLAACGHPEQRVVDKYFQAVNQKDNQTIGSFALVTFDKKVDKWVIKKEISENKEPAPLAALVKKQKEIEGQIADNRKKYNAYFLDNMKEVDEFRDIRKGGGKVPAKLSTVATEWEGYEQKEKELKKQLADAKQAVERETANMMVSVGTVDQAQELEGEVINKQIELELTINGQPETYLMNLRKYDVKPANGAKVISRWVISGLKPAARS
jgi:hypothetical protein